MFSIEREKEEFCSCIYRIGGRVGLFHVCSSWSNRDDTQLILQGGWNKMIFKIINNHADISLSNKLCQKILIDSM